MWGGQPTMSRRTASGHERSGTFDPNARSRVGAACMERPMNGLIYLVGLIVVIMFILSLLGLR
jgi:hypothetical protein